MKILVVEDSEIDYYLLKRHLSHAGLVFDSVHVETAKDFLAEVSTNHFDLVLADYQLPSFSPYQALQTLSSNNLKIPLIVVSGRLPEKEIESLKKAGAVDLACKDDFKPLVSAIRRALSQNVR